MDAVLRAVAIYAFLLVLFRIVGNRALAQITTFDFVLLLLIGEATQQGLLAEDYSLTNAFLVILTLVGLDLALSLLKQRFRALDRVIDGVPLVLVADGKLIRENMDRERVDEADILAAARHTQGLEKLDQIKFAVLERSGGISIIPKDS
ncbi:MAG: DUF421 domain-containing protein [Anaerolineae bacterium]